MLRTILAVAVLLLGALWNARATAGQPVTLTVTSCEGVKGAILPGGAFSCKVTLEPKDASATVLAYSRAIEAPLTQEVYGSGVLWFDVPIRIKPGQYSISLFAIKTDSTSIDSVIEKVIVVGEELVAPPAQRTGGTTEPRPTVASGNR